jgi:hypothetical protein
MSCSERREGEDSSSLRSDNTCITMRAKIACILTRSLSREHYRSSREQRRTKRMYGNYAYVYT